MGNVKFPAFANFRKHGERLVEKHICEIATAFKKGG